MSFHPIQDPHPCSFDPQILPNYILKKQENEAQGETPPFLLIEGGMEDYEKVAPLYNASPVKGFDIAKIEVVVNKAFSDGFNSMLKMFEYRSQQRQFEPTWDKDVTCPEEKLMREQVNDHLQTLAKIPKNFSHAKVVLMFHGTKKNLLRHIFSGNLAALSTTDNGFFGKGGVYHSSYASYANKYAAMGRGQGALLMNWVGFSSAYPVIH